MKSMGGGEAAKLATKTNWVRRAIGIAICFAPVALVLTSLTLGLLWPRESLLGVGLGAIGLLLAGFNLYLSVGRPLIYWWRHRSMEGYRFVSGFPGIGTLFVVASSIVGFSDWRAAALGIIALAVDTGGLPWFLVATWRDRSFWDA